MNGLGGDLKEKKNLSFFLKQKRERKKKRGGENLTV